MKKAIIKRTLKEAELMISTNKTIREIAECLKISKSTVHKDLKERLKEINKSKYAKIQETLKNHLNIRHLNGGEATRKKYAKLK